MKTKPAAALFASFKTSRAIPCSRPHRRDLLIQSTLDAGVRAIEYHPMVVLDDHVIRTDAIVLDRDDGFFAIDFVDARSRIRARKASSRSGSSSVAPASWPSPRPMSASNRVCRRHARSGSTRA